MTESFGFRDLEAGQPMRADTIFRVQSLTKPATAVAVMMLYEEGRFRSHVTTDVLPPNGPNGRVGYGMGLGFYVLRDPAAATRCVHQASKRDGRGGDISLDRPH